MKLSTIDTAIERYAHDRKTHTKKEAQEHFLSYAYLVFDVKGAEAFLKRTRGMLCYYIDYLSRFENPFRGPQAGWLLLMAIVFSFGIALIGDDDTCLTGLFIAAGTTANGVSLWRIVCARWLDTGIMIALYSEIIELIDSIIPRDSSQASA